MDPSARAMDTPVDITEEVLASLASPRMAAHLRESLRATGHFAPYGEIRFDGDDTQSSEDEALAAAETEAAEAEEEVLMLRALVRAIAARPPDARANADDDARRDAQTRASSHPRRPNTRASKSSSGSFPRARRFPAAEALKGASRTSANHPACADANHPASPLAPDVSAIRPRRGVGAPRWGPPPPRRPAAATSRAPAAVRAATARAVARALGDAPQPGGVAEAFADAEWRRAEEDARVRGGVEERAASARSSSTSDLTTAFAATRRRTPAAIIHRATTTTRERHESTSTSAKRPEETPRRKRRESEKSLRDFGREGGDGVSRRGAPAFATKPKPTPTPKSSVSSATSADDSADDFADDADAWWNRSFGDVRGGAGLRESSSAVQKTETNSNAKRSRAASASASASALASASASASALASNPSASRRLRTPSSTFMLSPDALAKALDRTRPAFSSRGATRWVPPPRAEISSSSPSSDSDAWDGGPVRRALRRRAGSESARRRRLGVDDDEMPPRAPNDPSRPRIAAGAGKWAPPRKKTTVPGRKETTVLRRKEDDDVSRVPTIVSAADDAAIRRRAPSATIAPPSGAARVRSRPESAPVPGPGHYAPESASAATRPSAPAVAFGEFSPADIRARGSDSEPRTRPFDSSVPLDVDPAAVARRVVGGVAFDRAPPRVTFAEEAYARALARESRATSAELTAAADPLARAVADGSVVSVAPPLPSLALVFPRVVGGAWSKSGSKSGSSVTEARTRDRPEDFRAAIRDALASSADPLGSWVASSSTARAKHVFVDFSKTLPSASSDDPSLDRRSVPWYPATHGPPDELARGRAAGGGVLRIRETLGRDEDGETRAKNRETEETRASPLLGTYRVVEALDFLRKATPATVFSLAADRWRANGRRRIRNKFASAAARRAAATMDADDDARALEDANEGPAWLTLEASRAADAATRPGAPAWTFLPLEVTRARDASGRDVAPGDRPALDVKVTLARRREDAGATRFGTASRFTSQKEANGTKVTNVGPGTYDAADAADALAPNAPAADFGRASRFESRFEREGDAFGDGDDALRDFADFDPAGAYARMVAPRVPAAVDIRRGTNPRADEASRRTRAASRTVRPLKKKSASASASAAWHALVDRSVDHALVDRSVDHETHAADARTSRAAAEARKSRALAKLDALVGGADALPDPRSDLATRRRAPGVDIASMTWRVSETAEGRVEMALLAAELGPGRYDPDDGVVAGRRRAPAADFATSVAPRFPETKRRGAEGGGAEGGGAEGGVDGSSFDGSPSSFAFDRVRPRTTVGGAMDRATRPAGDFADASASGAETLYDVERGLAFLRKHTRAADFASGSGSNPRGMDSSAADFARASRRGLIDANQSRRGDGDFEFADGDVLYLLPESADAAVYPRRDVHAPDFSRDVGRARGFEPAGEPAGDTTRDVDYLRERHLARLYPRLDAGSGAVRLDAPRARNRGGVVDFFARVTSAGDLDAGVYHDDAANVDARARRSGKSRAPNVDIAASGSRPVQESPKSRHDGAREGDALVLDPGPNPSKDKRTPSVSMGRARARWDVPGKDAWDGDAGTSHLGDAWTLDIPTRSKSRGVERVTRFGRAVGRGEDPTRAWTEDAVVHARRSERTHAFGHGDAHASRANETRVLARGAGRFGGVGVGRAAEARAEARARAPTRRAGDAAPRDARRTVVG